MVKHLLGVSLMAWLSLGWLGAPAAAAPVEATIADRASAISALRSVAVRSYAAAKNIELTETSVVTRNLAIELRRTLDAIERDARVHGFADEVVFARKSQQVRRLVENLERAQSAAPQARSSTPVPRQLQAERRIPVADLRTQGGTCASASSLRPGYELDAQLAPAGRPGSELWLRFRPEDAKFLRLTTAASPLDTELTLFKDGCPQADAEAVARNDDAFGLAAGLVIEAGAPRETWFARVRNSGDAGAVAVALEATAVIRGRISDQRNNAGIASFVQPFGRPGSTGQGAWSGNDGRYVLAVEPGAYYVYASSTSDNYVSELYPDAPCVSAIFERIEDCIGRGAQLVTVAADGIVDGIDIALNIGGRIAGTIRDRTTFAPIVDASVTLYGKDGTWLPQGNLRTDAAGRYLVSGLLTGNYFLLASANPYGSQNWRHQDCHGPVLQDCSPLTGTPIAVERDRLTGGIDFDLPRQASIRGSASAPTATTENPLYWNLTIFDGNGNSVSGASGSSNADIVSGPLAAGTYYATADAFGYVSQWWNGVACLPDCMSTRGLAVPVTVGGGEQAELSFSFKPLLTVSGRVTDAVTQEPLKEAEVSLIPVSGSGFAAEISWTTSDGRYVISRVVPGRYYVGVRSATHLDAVYPQVPCQAEFFQCDLSAAVAVEPSYPDGNVAGIDLALTPGGTISGRVALRVPDGVDPLPSPFASVTIVDGQNRTVAMASSSTEGRYTAVDLLPGTYYAKAMSNETFAQIYAGIDCEDENNCRATQGTPLIVGQSEQLDGIDFDVFPTDYIFGRVVDDSGQPVQGVVIDLWDSNSDQHVGMGRSNAEGYYAAESEWGGFPGRVFRASTDVGAADYDDQLYDGVACPIGSVYVGLCSIDDGSPIAAPVRPEFSVANFVLHGPRSHTLFRDGFDP